MMTTLKIARVAGSICTGLSSITRNSQRCVRPIRCRHGPKRLRFWSKPARKLTKDQPLIGYARRLRSLALRVQGRKFARRLSSEQGGGKPRPYNTRAGYHISCIVGAGLAPALASRLPPPWFRYLCAPASGACWLAWAADGSFMPPALNHSAANWIPVRRSTFGSYPSS